MVNNMLNKLIKPNEYPNYKFVEFAEEIQKLRKAKLMLEKISHKKKYANTQH